MISETKTVDGEQFSLITVCKRTLPDGEDIEGWMKTKNLKRNPSKRDQKINRQLTATIGAPKLSEGELPSSSLKKEPKDPAHLSGGSCEDSSSYSESDDETEIAMVPAITASHSSEGEKIHAYIYIYEYIH